MDLASLVTPGAQSLVTAILSDSWAHARSTLAQHWARRHSQGAGADADAVERAGRELEAARDQALALAGPADAAHGNERMRLFLAGYLAGQLAARPELADTVAALPALLGTGPTTTTTNTYTLSGEAQNVVQSESITGGVYFGRS
jgi:hypothetical protein